METSFTSPGYDYGADLALIERKKKIAEALQAQAMQPIEQAQVPAGGFASNISPWQGAAKIAQALAGKIQERKADAKTRELSTRAQSDYQRMVNTGLRQLTGTPERTIQPDPQEAQQSADQGTPEVAARTIPRQAPNPAAAMATFGSDPRGQAMMPLAMQEMQRQRLVQSLQQPQIAAVPAQPQAAAGATAPSYGSPGFNPAAPQGQPAPQGMVIGGPAGGMPMEAWLRGNPESGYQKYLEQLAKEHMESEKPVIDRGYGIKKWNPVTRQYDLASNPADITKVEQAKLAASQQYEPPITLKTSEGREIQLSRPEYAEYQKTNQLPARLGGQPQPAGMPPQAGGVRVPGAPGLGTIGINQSQPDTIRQQGQLAANTEAGREFIAEMRRNYGLLRDVPAALENMDRAKALATTNAAKFMGPLGESRLQVTKFLRANVPGMGNLNTEGVKSVEELRSSLFNQVMDNLKKMDASPSQYQQQVMQEAFGTLGTDPQAVPRMLDVFGDILRNRVDIHNSTVSSAEGRGTTFPYDVKIKVKPKTGGGGLNLSPATVEFMKANGIALPQQ